MPLRIFLLFKDYQYTKIIRSLGSINLDRWKITGVIPRVRNTPHLSSSSTGLGSRSQIFTTIHSNLRNKTVLNFVGFLVRFLGPKKLIGNSMGVSKNSFPPYTNISTKPFRLVRVLPDFFPLTFSPLVNHL